MPGNLEILATSVKSQAHSSIAPNMKVQDGGLVPIPKPKNPEGEDAASTPAAPKKPRKNVEVEFEDDNWFFVFKANLQI